MAKRKPASRIRSAEPLFAFDRLLALARSLDGAGACALFFEVLTAALSIIDVAADVLVALQFYNDGHTAWAYAVVASLVVSSIAYTIYFFNEIMCSDPVIKHYYYGADVYYSDTSRSKIIAFCAVFPFAQFLPTFVWAVGVLHEHDLSFTWIAKASRNNTDDRGWAALEGSTTDSGAAKGPCGAAIDEEISQSRAGASLMRRVHSSLEHHLRTHMLFYIETLTEAVPQALIQLLAMTCATTAGDGPTSLQLFSMAMSLLTICSKAYLVSLSFDFKIFVFKAVLAVHDLFALFYVYSTLLAPRHEDSWGFDPFGFGVEFGLVSTVWLLRMAVVVCAACLCFFLVFIDSVTDIKGRLPHPCEVRDFFQISGVILVGFVPAAVALDGAKLAWFSIIDLLHAPPSKYFPALSALLAFTRKADSAAERHERVMHVSHLYAVADRAFLTKQKKAEASANQTWYIRYLTRQIQKCESIAALTTGPAMRRTSPFCLRLVTHGNPSGSPQGWLRERVCGDDVTTTAAAVMTVFTTACVFYGVTQAVLLLFPVLNIAVEGVAHQNSLQLFTAGVCTACLVVAASMSLHALDYARFAAAVQIAPSNRASNVIGEALTMIRHFVVPTSAAVVTAGTPHAVVSRAVSELVVGPYLPPHAVDMAQLSSEQCRAIRQTLNEDY